MWCSTKAMRWSSPRFQTTLLPLHHQSPRSLATRPLSSCVPKSRWQSIPGWNMTHGHQRRKCLLFVLQLPTRRPPSVKWRPASKRICLTRCRHTTWKLTPLPLKLVLLLWSNRCKAWPPINNRWKPPSKPPPIMLTLRSLLCNPKFPPRLTSKASTSRECFRPSFSRLKPCSRRGHARSDGPATPLASRVVACPHGFFFGFSLSLSFSGLALDLVPPPLTLLAGVSWILVRGLPRFIDFAVRSLLSVFGFCHLCRFFSVFAALLAPCTDLECCLGPRLCVRRLSVVVPLVRGFANGAGGLVCFWLFGSAKLLILAPLGHLGLLISMVWTPKPSFWPSPQSILGFFPRPTWLLLVKKHSDPTCVRPEPRTPVLLEVPLSQPDPKWVILASGLVWAHFRGSLCVACRINGLMWCTDLVGLSVSRFAAMVFGSPESLSMAPRPATPMWTVAKSPMSSCLWLLPGSIFFQVHVLLLGISIMTWIACLLLPCCPGCNTKTAKMSMPASLASSLKRHVVAKRVVISCSCPVSFVLCLIAARSMTTLFLTTLHWCVTSTVVVTCFDMLGRCLTLWNGNLLTSVSRFPYPSLLVWTMSPMIIRSFGTRQNPATMRPAGVPENQLCVLWVVVLPSLRLRSVRCRFHHWNPVALVIVNHCSSARACSMFNGPNSFADYSRTFGWCVPLFRLLLTASMCRVFGLPSVRPGDSFRRLPRGGRPVNLDLASLQFFLFSPQVRTKRCCFTWDWNLKWTCLKGRWWAPARTPRGFLKLLILRPCMLWCAVMCLFKLILWSPLSLALWAMWMKMKVLSNFRVLLSLMRPVPWSLNLDCCTSSMPKLIRFGWTLAMGWKSANQFGRKLSLVSLKTSSMRLNLSGPNCGVAMSLSLPRNGRPFWILPLPISDLLAHRFLICRCSPSSVVSVASPSMLPRG